MIFVDSIVIFFSIHDIRCVQGYWRTSKISRCIASWLEIGMSDNKIAAEILHTTGQLSELLVGPPKDDEIGRTRMK